MHYQYSSDSLVSYCFFCNMVKIPISSVRFVGGGGVGGLTPHWLKMTPTLVTENFCLGGPLRHPSPHNVQMISKYGTFHSNLED